jgi:hypothetical protein
MSTIPMRRLGRPLRHPRNDFKALLGLHWIRTWPVHDGENEPEAHGVARPSARTVKLVRRIA